MERRQYLTAITSASALLITGCSEQDNTGDGTNSNESDSPEESSTPNGNQDTTTGPPDAVSLLPQPEDYTLEEQNPQAAGMVGADNGIQGVYSADDGTEFSVEIIVYARDDGKTAENNVSIYTTDENWTLVVLHKNVIYAVSELPREEAIDVLASRHGWIALQLKQI
jgi:hypothetical protein